MPGIGGSRGQLDGRDRHAKSRAGHRQPEWQERGKSGVSDRHGYDAGKKFRGKKRHVLVDPQGCLCIALSMRQTSRTVMVAYC